MFYSYYQLVDKLNTNTEMEEMINDYNIVSKLCTVNSMIIVLNVKSQKYDWTGWLSQLNHQF